MSLGFPAFLRQFWLHFRKNFRKNLEEKNVDERKTTLPAAALSSINEASNSEGEKEKKGKQ